MGRTSPRTPRSRSAARPRTPAARSAAVEVSDRQRGHVAPGHRAGHVDVHAGRPPHSGHDDHQGSRGRRQRQPPVHADLRDGHGRDEPAAGGPDRADRHRGSVGHHTWTGLTRTGAAGYNVYRSDQSNGTYTKVNGAPPVTHLGVRPTPPHRAARRDTSYYKVTALNAAGSNPRRPTPPTPPGLRHPAPPPGSPPPPPRRDHPDLDRRRPGPPATTSTAPAAAGGTFTKMNGATAVTTPTYTDTTAPAARPDHLLLQGHRAEHRRAESAQSDTASATRTSATRRPHRADRDRHHRPGSP